jgi:hypothetical protein
MPVRTVTREERDATLRFIARCGTERLVDEVDNGDGTVTITTDRLTERPLETR